MWSGSGGFLFDQATVAATLQKQKNKVHEKPLPIPPLPSRVHRRLVIGSNRRGSRGYGRSNLRRLTAEELRYGTVDALTRRSDVSACIRA